MNRLTESQKKVLKFGAARLSLDWEELVEGVEAAAAGRGSRALSGLTIGSTPVLEKPKVSSPFLPLALDPEVPNSWSLGWASVRQQNASRFDARDIAAYSPALWYSQIWKMVNLPARLVLNILLADIAHTAGTGQLIDEYNSWGLLSSEDDFVEKGKLLSNAAKLGAVWLVNPDWYKECATLVGCRYPDADTDVRVSDLIRTEAHDELLPHPDAFEAYLQTASTQKFKSAARIEKLDSFVKNMSWQTDGSATATGLDSLIYEVDGKVFKLRLTKSLIPYIAVFEDVLSSVKSCCTQTFVIIKAILKLGETSKDRVIYPYPLMPTIIKSYLLAHLAESSNYPLDGVHLENRAWSTSLGSSGWEEVHRHLRTLSVVAPDIAAIALERAQHVYTLMRKLTPLRPDYVTVSVAGNAVVVLASDVKGFDKQIGHTYTTEFWDTVRDSIPAAVFSSLSARTDGVPFGEYLLPPDQSIRYDTTPHRKDLERTSNFKVLIAVNKKSLVINKRYLTSGTLETSKVGNRVSYCVCRGAASVLVRIWRASVEMFDVRGDDQLAALRGKTPGHARLLAKIWWVYCSAFLEYSPDKSRITEEGQGETEFLRIEYGRQGAKGYLNRSLVWLGEARPFSEESGYAVCPKAIAALDNCATSERRGATASLRKFLYMSAVRALASKGFPASILHVPKSVGGAGVMPPAGGSVSLRPDSPDSAPVISDWAVSLVEERFSDFKLSESEAKTLAAVGVSSMIQADMGKISVGYKPELRITPFAVERVSTEILARENPDHTFGQLPQIANIFEKTAAVARVRGVKTISLLSKRTAGLIRSVEKRYSLPRRLAIDWLSGTLSGYTGSLHPELIFICARMVATYMTLHNYRKLWDYRTSYLFISSMMFACATALQRQMSLTHSW